MPDTPPLGNTAAEVAAGTLPDVVAARPRRRATSRAELLPPAVRE